MSRYTDLVEDPEAEEKARALLQNPWTPDEKETFVKKLELLGKDFKKIASHIDGKTTADCVEFYYLNKKSGLFDWRNEKTKARVVKEGGAASCSSKSRRERKHEKKPAPAPAAAAELSGSEGGKRKRVQTEKVRQFIEAEKRISCSGKMEIKRVKIKFGSRCFAPTHAGSGSAAGLIL